MNFAPIVTIIVAVFNGAKTLQQCIDSVATQTYLNKELIIIDGGSTDGSVEILRNCGPKISYWVSESDKGIYHAWNKAVAKAHGEWICFIGADDYFCGTTALEEMVSALIFIPLEIKVAYGNVMLLGKNGEDLFLIGEPWEQVKHKFKQIMSIPHPGLMHRRSLFQQNGNFDESFKIAGDYELLLRELLVKDAYYIPDVNLVAMRTGGVSSDPKKTLVGLRELRLAQRKNGLMHPGRIWLQAVASTFTRLLLWTILGEKLARKLLDRGRKILGLPEYWTKT